MSFKGQLGFFEKKPKELKSGLNEILKGGYKSEKQESEIKNIKTLYKLREKVN